MRYLFNNFIGSAYIKIFVALLILITISIFSLSQGYADIHFSTMVKILWEMINSNDHSQISESSKLIITEIRLPRLIASIIVGGALAYSGATYQGIFRNPLADPFLLGIASGASFGIASPGGDLQAVIEALKFQIELVAQSNHMFVQFAQDGGETPSGIALQIKDLDNA